MRVLVTGGTGLLGNNVVRSLLDRGDFVRVLIRGGDRDARPLAGLNVDRVLGDVCDEAAVKAACHSMDAVVHAAASCHIGWHGIEEQRKINVGGTALLASSARQSGARFVYISSVNALGLGKKNQPANEETPLGGNILCGYVLTKREAEQAVLAEVAQGLHGVIVNPGFMLGPWDWKPSSGRMLISVAKHFVPLAPRGGCSFCDARDVASGVISAMEKGRVGQRYILAGHNVSYLELWRMFARVAGSRGPLARMGPMQRWSVGGWIRLVEMFRSTETEINSAVMRMGDQYHYYSSKLARTELGYQVRTSDTIVTDAWNWLRENQFA